MKLGNYRLLDFQGSESACDWYEAREEGTERPIRIGVCWGDAAESPVWSAIAGRLRILAQVDHPGVIPVVELCLENHPPFAALAKPGGVSLQEQIEKTAYLPEQAVLEMGHCLAGALAEAHRLGLAHGRLTESRIWIDEFNDVAIDFAPLIASSDRAPTLLGNLDDPLAGAAADVAALGLILRRMIGGLEERPGAFNAAIGSEEAIQSLPDLLDWMLARDPDSRPNATEVVRCIRRLMGDSEQLRRVEATGVGALNHDSTRFPDQGKGDASSILSPRQVGRYRLLKKLGEGGLGVVYLAEDSADGARVAVKVLHAQLGANEASVRRFRKEARLLAEVKSAHICQLIDFNEDQGVHYLVMEYLQGESLGAFLAKYKRLPEPVALALVSDVARALGEAHRNGIVHRDVKPDNIMLLGPWKAVLDNEAGAADFSSLPGNALAVKLCDFGLARHVEQSASMNLTRTGQFLGTPLYMSPEQAGADSAVTPASDVYSLGATLFHLLTGRPPFQAASIAAIYAMHLNADAPSPQEFNPGLSAAVCQVVKKALAKEPRARYADADQFLLDLERMLRGEPTHLAIHPRLPAFAPGELLDYDWVLELNASPEQLWPFVSNTERLNQAIGLSAVNYAFRFITTDNSKLQPRLERTGTIRKPGLTITWVEHPFEWIEGRRMGILREYSEGVFRWMASTTELQARADGGTTLHHRVQLVPAGLFGRVIAALQVGMRGRSAVEKVYRRIDAYLTHQLPHSPATDPFVPPASPAATTQEMSHRFIEKFLARGIAPVVAESLVDFALRAPAQEITRIRPIALAQRLQLDEAGLIEACLIAAHEGLLVILWDLVCPKCRVPSAIEKTMQDIRSHGQCQACNLDFELDFANSVELVFRVDPSIRPSEMGVYCIGGPSHSPHVAAQVRVAAAERLELTMNLAEGSYRLRGPQLPYSVDFRVHPEASAVRGELRLIKGPALDFPRTFRSGAQTFLLNNEYSDELVVRIERLAERRDALTAARVSALACFRDLFPQEVLAGKQLVSVAHVTLLATDLAGAAGLYHELGDARTFGLLHEHFRILEEHIRREHGAVVKTHNEGILATFHDPASAVRVALDLQNLLDKNATTKPLCIRVGVHRGSAMVATINGRLDYFGTTVKLAMRLPGLVQASEIVLTQPLVSDPQVQTLLSRRGLTCKIFQGESDLQGDLPLYRLEPDLKSQQIVKLRPPASFGSERHDQTPVG